MDSLHAAATVRGPKNTAIFAGRSAKAQANLHLVQNLAKYEKTDRVEFGPKGLYQSLSLTAQKVIDKLNELIKGEVPGGIQSLNPSDFTPEKTADRIVAGVTGLFGVFAKRNPELGGEELVRGFMDTIRAGVHRGYDQAFSILKDIGAFKFEGIQSGVEKTKALVDEKLAAFEVYLSQKLGVTRPEADQAAAQTLNNLLPQSGAQLQQARGNPAAAPTLDQVA